MLQQTGNGIYFDLYDSLDVIAADHYADQDMRELAWYPIIQAVGSLGRLIDTQTGC